jgi:hypothetical protein
MAVHVCISDFSGTAAFLVWSADILVRFKRFGHPKADKNVRAPETIEMRARTTFYTRSHGQA